MAQQLQSTGDSVAMLVILDTPAPGLQHYLHAHQSLNVFAQTVLGGVWEYLRDYEYLVAESKAPRVRRVLGIGKSFLERAAIARVVPAESRLLMYHLPTIREMVQLFIKGLTATLRYRPSIYSGSVTLLRTNAHGAEGDYTALLGWDTVSSQAVQVRQIPGTHLTLLRQPHLQPVAQVLQAVIDEAHQAQEDYRATPASPAYTAAR
jgi:thioesterase domain-containing protein